MTIPAENIVWASSARMSLKGFERCTELSLPQLQLLGRLGTGPLKSPDDDHYREAERVMRSLLTLLRLDYAVESLDGGWEITDTGRAHLRHASIIAEHQASAALADANEERERGRDATKLLARAQRWLDIANDLSGRGSR